MKNNKGVTLVALVITIIVLLILAGVALAMLTGDSGILTNAENAKSETTTANAKSAIEMAYMDIKTEVYAIEAGSSTVTMNSAKMKEIAERYCPAATVKASTTEGENEITIDYSKATGSDLVANADLSVATITYDSSASPRVQLDGAERETSND